MTTFNTPPTQYLPAAKSKPGRITIRTHLQAAQKSQRKRWRNQVGYPPIQRSRAGRPWETWELTWLQDPAAPSVEVLATWTGRTAHEIHQKFAALDELGPAEKKTKLLTNCQEEQVTKEKRTMPKKLTIPDDEIRRVYQEYYIGRSESTVSCGDHLGIGDATFRKCAKRLGLRMRTIKEGQAAKSRHGRPWTWLDEESAESQTPLARPNPPALKSAPPAEATPEPAAEPAPAPEPDNPARELALTDPGPGRRAIVISAEPYPPAEIVQANGYHSPALGDVARLVRDLTAAGANVDIRLNIGLEVRP